MKKLVLFVVLIAAICYLIFWLWQRQPKGVSKAVLSDSSASIPSPSPQDPLNISPSDTSVFSTSSEKLSGKYTPNSFLAIYSDADAAFTKTDAGGNFTLTVNFDKGVNLLTLSLVSSDLMATKDRSLTYFVSTDDSLKNVYAGAVKTIFDTLITLTTAGAGDKTVRTGSSTNFVMPQDINSQETTGSAVQNIRIGDYAIALGSSTENDSLIATKLYIERTNIPQNTRKLALMKIVAAPKLNVFTAKTLKDSKLIDFTLNRNSSISQGEQEAKAADMEKDKNVAIIYHDDNGNNIVDAIYIFP